MPTFHIFTRKDLLYLSCSVLANWPSWLSSKCNCSRFTGKLFPCIFRIGVRQRLFTRNINRSLVTTESISRSAETHGYKSKEAVIPFHFIFFSILMICHILLKLTFVITCTPAPMVGFSGAHVRCGNLQFILQ